MPLAVLAPLPWSTLALRLLLATVLGSIIGWDREYDQKAAGLRTNMLVSLGAALFVLIPIQAGIVDQHPDTLSRAIQGVITGVGFVGAGSILRHKRVQGLTSAAAIWVSAGLGVASGVGQWELGVLGVVLAVVILRGIKILERQHPKSKD